MRAELKQLAATQSDTQRSAMTMSQGYMQSIGAMAGSTQRYKRAANNASSASRQYATSLHQAAAASRGLMQQSRATQSSLLPINKTLMATAGIVAGMSFLRQTGELIDYNASLQTSSEHLSVNAQELQVWEATAKNFNLTGEQMRDILKDVSDKIGDFANGEGGEAKNIIEKLGLDINTLINLNPVEQLKLINAELEKTANISPSEKIFLMESLANDASKLLPMLKDNNAALVAMQITMEQRGTIITAEESALLLASNDQIKDIQSAVSGLTQKLGLAGAEFLNAFGPNIAASIDYIADNLEGIGDIVEVLSVVIAAKLVGALAASAVATTRAALAASSFGATATASYNTAAASAGRLVVANNALAASNARVAASSASAIGKISSLGGATSRSYASVTRSTGAMAAASRVGTVALRGIGLAMGLLGGPVGVALTAAYGIYAYVSSTREAERASQLAAAGIDTTGQSFATSGEAASWAETQVDLYNQTSLSGIDAAIDSVAAHILEAESYREVAAAALEAAIAKAQADKVRLSSAKGIRKGAIGLTVDADLKQIKAEQVALKEAEKNILSLRESYEKLQGSKDKAAESSKKVAEKFSVTGKKADGAKKSTQGLSAAQKALKKSSDDAARAQKQLEEAFKSEKESLIARTKELTEGAEAAYIYTKQNQDFTEKMIKQLVTIKRNNKALEETKKNKKELKKYYDDELASLDEQIAKLKLSEREYYANTKAIKKLTPALQAELVARYDIVLAAEKQKEADKKRVEEAKKAAEEIASIGDDLALSLAEKLTGGTESWGDILKNWWSDIKAYFAKNVLQPLIQPFTQGITGAAIGSFSGGGAGGLQTQGGGMGGLGGIGGFLGKGGSIFGKGGLVFGHSIGEGIVTFADKFGATAGKMFSKGVSMSNAAFGVAGVAGGILGSWGQKGTYGGIGGAGGAMAGLAIGGPVGAVIGGLAGAALGGLFGGQTTDNAAGLSLGLGNGGQIGMQTFQDKHKDGGWIKKAKDWTEYNDDLSETQQKIKDALQTQFDSALDMMVEVTEYFGYESAAGVVEGLRSGLEVVDPSVAGFAESVVATQFSDTQASLISGLSEFQNVDLGAEQAAQGLRSVIQEYGSILSQTSVEEFDRIQLTENGEQVSEQEATARIQEWLSNTLSGIFENVIGSDFDQYAISGENLAETLGRVYGEVDFVTTMTEQMGLQFGLTGMEAIGAANSLVTTAGGLQALGTISQGYIGLLYSESEQREMVNTQAKDNLLLLNQQHGTNITTAASLRDVIDGLDLTSISGQEAYVKLSAFIPVLTQLGNTADNLKTMMSGVKLEYRQLTTDKRTFAVEQLKTARTEAINDATELGATDADIADINNLFDIKQAKLLVDTKSVGLIVEGIDDSVHVLSGSLGIVQDAVINTNTGIQNSIDKIELGDAGYQAQDWTNSGWTEAMIEGTTLLQDTFIGIQAAANPAAAATKVSTKSTNEATKATEAANKVIDDAAAAQQRLQDAYEQDKASLESQVFALTHSTVETQKRAWAEKDYTASMIATLSSLTAKAQALEKTQQITANFDSELKGLQDYQYELNRNGNEIQYRIWTEKEYSKAMIESLQQLKIQISITEQLNAANDTYTNYKEQLSQQHRELTLSTEGLRLYQYGIENLTDTMIADIESLKAANDALVETQRIDTAFEGYKQSLKDQGLELRLGKLALQDYKWGVEGLTATMIAELHTLQAANDALIETQRIDTAFEGYKQSLKDQGLELRLGKLALQDYKWGIEGLSDTMIAELHTLQAANDAYANTVSLFGSQLEAVGSNYQIKLENLNDSYTDQIDTFEKLKEAAKDLRDIVSDLRFSDLSILNPVDQLTAAREEFSALKASALAGDATAAAGVGSAGQRLLELSRAYNASSDAYIKDYNLVGNGLENVADQVDALRDPALDLLDKQDDLIAASRDEFVRLTELYQSAISQETWLQTIDANLTSLPDLLGAAVAAAIPPPPAPVTNTIYIGTQDTTIPATANDVSYNGTALTAPPAIDGSHYDGLPSVPRDGYIAKTHKAEAIVSAPDMTVFRKYGIPARTSSHNDNSEIVSELRALRDDNKAMQAEIIKLRKFQQDKTRAEESRDSEKIGLMQQANHLSNQATRTNNRKKMQLRKVV